MGCAVVIWSFGTEMAGFGAVLTPIKREPKPRAPFLSGTGAEATSCAGSRFLCTRSCFFVRALARKKISAGNADSHSQRANAYSPGRCETGMKFFFNQKPTRFFWSAVPARVGRLSGQKHNKNTNEAWQTTPHRRFNSSLTDGTDCAV